MTHVNFSANGAKCKKKKLPNERIGTVEGREYVTVKIYLGGAKPWLR